MTSGVYVIQCNNKNKYYVGKSENIENRINQHKSGDGAKFIKNNGGVYKQIDLLTHNNTDDLGLREQQETLAQMLVHGFNNVRGWEFTSSVDLTYEECVSIKTLILGSGDFCRKCGSSEHFIKDCENKKEDWLIELENCMEQPKKKEENIFKSIINNKKNIITDFELEFAKTNRGKCKICETNIDKDELKIGIKETNYKQQEYIKWYHIDCFKKHNNIDMNIVEDFYNKNKGIIKKKEVKDKKVNNKDMNYKKGDKIGIEYPKDIMYGTIKYVNKNKLILQAPYYWYPKDKTVIGGEEYTKCNGEHEIGLPPTPHKIIEYNHIEKSVVDNLENRLSGKIVPPKGWGSVMSKCIFCQQNGILPFMDNCIKCNKEWKEPTINIHLVRDSNPLPDDIRLLVAHTWFLNTNNINYDKHNYKSKNTCFRCGREGHYADSCYAKTDVNGDSIDDESSEEEVWICSYCDKEFYTEKGALFHEYKYCKRNPKRYY